MPLRYDSFNRDGQEQPMDSMLNGIDAIIKKLDALSDSNTEAKRLRADMVGVVNEYIDNKLALVEKTLEQKLKMDISAEVTKALHNRVRVEDLYTSRTRTFDNYVVKDYSDLLLQKGSGRISQILFTTATNTYRIRIMIDDTSFYDKPYSYFLAYSGYIDNITAVLVDGVYYLSLKDLFFQKSIVVSVTATSPIVFTHVLLKYEVKDVD